MGFGGCANLIPLVRPDIPPVDAWRCLYEDALVSGQLSNQGAVWRRASELLEALTGVPAVPVSNGTLALQVALSTLLPTGARVAIPDFTFVATGHAVLGARLEPVLVDCSSITLQPNEHTLRKHRKDFDAFVVVSPFGYAVDFAFWDRLSVELERPVVYDLAGAWGMGMETRNICTMSFHATKSLPIGEGGAIFTDSPQAHADIISRCNFGLDASRVSSGHQCTNAKMDELHAAVLCAQLERAPEIAKRVERRRKLVELYARECSSQLQMDSAWIEGSGPRSRSASAPSLATLHAKNGAQRVVNALAAFGIVARRAYYPLLCDHPAFSAFDAFARSSTMLENFVCLPSDITADEAGQICRIISSL